MNTVSGIFRSVVRSVALAAACVVVAASASASAAAAASEQQFTYRVEMSPYGSIGTYRNVVQKNGGETTITTEAHIKVSLVGVVLYRLDIARIARRTGDRLVYFHGITDENGTSTEVNGRAAGEQFVITSPNGRITAPGTIRPSDPWSAAVPGTSVVFMPDTGAVTRVQTSEGKETSITLNGVLMPVLRYRIATADGREQYQIWLNDRRVPVMFTIVDDSGATTFTLAK
ncbi:MAG TPA: DUF6134 family protein [Stellaceae bacterium]|nr:DUF6134 family protein [Stellaceae bacterium]